MMVGAQMTAELLHARFNHRRAEVLRLFPQCMRDAPGSWATIARNSACEEWLTANSHAVHSTAHLLPTKAGGDIASCDIYCVSTPHVHGVQKYVVNFHDHCSTLTMPYLLARKSDAFRAIQHCKAFCKLHHVIVRRTHTESAADLTSKQIRDFLLQNGT
eukprot:1532701-Pleurochrysis_carterae.AAC.3